MTAAAWHPDPTGRHELRYWDGTQWTEHVSDGGVVSSSPLNPPTEQATQDSGQTTQDSGQMPQGSDRPTPQPEAVREQPADEWISAPAQESSPADDAAMDRTMVARDPLSDPMPSDTSDQAPADVQTPDPSNTEESMGEAPVATDEPAAAAEPMSSEPPLAETMAVPAYGDAAPAAEPAAAPSYEPSPYDGGAQPPASAPPAYQPAPSYPGQQQDYGQAPGPYAAQPADAPAGQPDPAMAGAFQGISGDLVDGRFSEVGDSPGPSLQNSKLLKVRVVEPFMARNGAMVAYQGNVVFNYQGGGAAKFLKKALTGEGLKLMRVEGQGDVFLADAAHNVHILQINNSGLSINGDNVLAFSASLDWNIERVKGGSIAAGGLFNTTLRGTGWVAITTDGDPVVLNAAEAPTFADTNAIVAWSINLQTSIKSSFTAGALIGRGSGEAFQVAFNGPGFVIVQPSEGATVPPHTH